jgi:hypothetical protein
MWTWLASFLGGPVITGLINAYKAKLAAGNTADKIAADLAARELAVEQREQELRVQTNIADGGRWWTAAPRALVMWAGAIYFCKGVLWDTVLGWGSTPALHGDLATWMGWLMSLWFLGRSGEKIASILARK